LKSLFKILDGSLEIVDKTFCQTIDSCRKGKTGEYGKKIYKPESMRSKYYFLSFHYDAVAENFKGGMH
jgi:hypothetical protein